MDPITPIIGMAPPEWIPALILAYLVYQGWKAWVGKGKPDKPTDDYHQDPNVKG